MSLPEASGLGKLTMIWLLSHQGLQKPGDNGFLGESYPVQRELFVITGKALSSFKGHVSQHEEPEEWVSDWFP